MRCDLCKNKNKVILYKKSTADLKSQKTAANVVRNIRASETVNIHEQLKSKKKRKKDKNAGLLYSLKKNDDNTAKSVVNLCQKTQTLNIQQKSTIQLKPNISNNKNSNSNANKNNAKLSNRPKAKLKNITQPLPKRNNLLLLANALKANSKQSTSSTQADKLKQMLR